MAIEEVQQPNKAPSSTRIKESDFPNNAINMDDLWTNIINSEKTTYTEKIELDNKKINVLKGKYFAKNNFPDPIKATIQIVKDILQDIPEELRPIKCNNKQERTFWV